MVQITAKERAGVDELIQCISEAMTRLDDVDPAYANKTKLQKLLYLAIDEFKLPITYSWYLAGAVVPSGVATPDKLQTAFNSLQSTDSPSLPNPTEKETDGDVDETADMETQEVSTTSLDDLIDTANAGLGINKRSVRPETEEPLDPILFSTDLEADNSDERRDAVSIIGDRHDEICDFYESVLPKVWKQNTMRFLQNFYLEHAPQPYANLYVQSTHLRIRLRDIQYSVEDHLQGTEPARSVPETVQMIGRDISDLHYMIRSSKALADTFDAVLRGTDSMEDGLMKLEQLDPDEFTYDHLTVVKRMQEFFFYYVWRYPCLVISEETAAGPSAQVLQEIRRHRLADFEAELAQERESFGRDLANAGLLPEYTDYPPHDDELGAGILSLAKQYLN